MYQSKIEFDFRDPREEEIILPLGVSLETRRTAAVAAVHGGRKNHPCPEICNDHTIQLNFSSGVRFWHQLLVISPPSGRIEPDSSLCHHSWWISPFFIRRLIQRRKEVHTKEMRRSTLLLQVAATANGVGCRYRATVSSSRDLHRFWPPFCKTTPPTNSSRQEDEERRSNCWKP
ncbi:hypothetical protein JCGZ_06590 [Jatropha curcas]|uniref:Uncharacterized protein n=1 Tax=Jatropha curcas TaxID=180498 RepID=A0A067LNM6_JATCU|nr:hypothetical protein JCGZ_06590 [Jatropha curcas]